MVVNVITWNKAFSVFPLVTFIQKRGYMLQPSDDYFMSLVVKYTQRGWKIQETMWPEDHRVNHPLRRYRRIGDRYSWRIPLDISNVKWSKTPDAVLEFAQFGLSCSEGSYDVLAMVYKSHAQQYRYTYSDPIWCRFLGRRVTRLTGFELRKSAANLRPPDFQQMVKEETIHRIELDKPCTWTYWDSEIPKWYEAWEEKYGTERERQQLPE